MLGEYYQIIVVNNSGQTVTYDAPANGRINLAIQGVYVDPATGKPSYNAVSPTNAFGAADSVANGGNWEFGEIDNSSTLYPNALVTLSVTHDEGAAAAGTFDLYYESGATGALPSDGSAYSDPETNGLQFIGSLIWDASPDDDQVMYSNQFLI